MLTVKSQKPRFFDFAQDDMIEIARDDKKRDCRAPLAMTIEISRAQLAMTEKLILPMINRQLTQLNIQSINRLHYFF